MARFAVLCILLSAAPLAAQDRLAQADSALNAGQAWHASQLLAPVLALPATRTANAVILAARAAAAWEGWPTVRQLLEREPWLDSRFDRLGHRLLAEAALADGRNADALLQALAAAIPDTARSLAEQGRRLTILARAFDRLDQTDSAAAAYRRAANLVPPLADWLRLRAASASKDSAVRTLLYSAITVPAAAARVPWIEAAARERTGDLDGAAARFDALGAWVAAARVRWHAATTDSGRRLVATTLASRLATSSSADTRDALDLIDQIHPPFSREERLAVARRAAAVARNQDAVDQFAGAAHDAPLTDRDRFTYATTLATLSRWADAANEFAGIHDSALAGQAAYGRARALLRGGDGAVAIPALHAVVAQFPGDTAAASIALLLLGDLALDDGNIDTTRAMYLALATMYPTSSQRNHALLIAALIALAHGDAAGAATDISRGLAARPATGLDDDALHYWLARARIASGDSIGGRTILHDLLVRGPENYYAVRAAARLDTVPWHDVSPGRERTLDSVNGAFARAALLHTFGMDSEAKLERDRLASDARGADSLLTTAVAFAARGFFAQAAQLAARAATAGASKDRVLWRLLYPLPFDAALRDDAKRENVDPYLAASVIKQESGFEPHATSRTNARGLMQVEPTTGRELASLAGVTDFDPALLWVPDVNLALGMHHFAGELARYPEVERALAGYNAGTSRVDQWSATPLNGKVRPADHARDPLDDVEMFVERIPFVETRGYVRAILTNLTVYRMLYPRSSP